MLDLRPRRLRDGDLGVRLDNTVEFVERGESLHVPAAFEFVADPRRAVVDVRELPVAVEREDRVGDPVLDRGAGFAVVGRLTVPILYRVGSRW